MVKNLPANAGDIRDVGLIPAFERSPGGGHGSPLQHSCLYNNHASFLRTVSGKNLLANPVILKCQLWVAFSRQEYWSGLPCSPPGDLPNPGIKRTSPVSPALAGGTF